MSSRNDLKFKNKLIIIDFGSQVTKLIARRIRDFKVYCEIVNVREFKQIKEFDQIKGIILFGLRQLPKKYPKISKDIFEKNIPILGICYGLQLISKILGGKIKNLKKKREFGEAL